jgi:Dolichyl-phosphate-mannose-protein mannosyltransferase
VQDSPANTLLQSNVPSSKDFSRPILLILAIFGVVARLGIVILAGNRLTAPWSGVGDVQQYVTLASNVLAGDGFSYAHVPTAFRPPLYPLLLAALMWLSPAHWPAILRAVQLAVSLATAWVSSRLAARWFGTKAGRIALVAALLLPTQLYFTGEILTECTASLLGILFLAYLDDALQFDKPRSWMLLGLIAGIAALDRFNAAALPLIAAAFALGWPVAPAAEGKRPAVNSSVRWRNLALLVAPCAIVIAPWLAYTAISFHGHALYSTHAGFGAVEGVLSPTGRAQEGESEKLVAALGWTNATVETNTPQRPELRNELALNRQAGQVALQLWRHIGWQIVPIMTEKLGAFWLSTDQMLHLSMFSTRNRILRRTGVLAYWVVLLLALAGWLRLRKIHPRASRMLLFYAIVLTVMQLPLTMNTRLRSPLFDPVLVSLAGGGWLSLRDHFRAIKST